VGGNFPSFLIRKNTGYFLLHWFSKKKGQWKL